ncbi:MAG: hypothetical protein RIB45_11740 [Marivibrio sp.]|uniref:hypothetical protein n=1 Tax=Marivibrio sp. TaxID=2039719 RepID=UPI0032EC47DD
MTRASLFRRWSAPCLFAGLALAAAPTAAQQVIAPNLSEAAAMENTRPIAVNQLELERRFEFREEQRGAHGVVYRLERPTRVGRQTLQLGYSHEGEAKIARLALQLSDNATVNRLVLTDAVEMLAETLRPQWTTARQNAAVALEGAFADWSADKPDSALALETDRPGETAALRLYPSRAMATVDLRPRLPRYRLLDQSATTRLLEDSTLIIRPADGRPPYRAYHAPDRLLSGQADGADGLDTGSWRVAADGTYCVEMAPTAGWRCSVLVDVGDGGYAMMDAVEGRPTGVIRARLDFDPGNPESFFVARVADTLPSDMVLELTSNHTERRRPADGGPPVTVYFRPDGTFKEGPEEGRWNILQDGRRCWKVEAPDPGPWRCVFLREEYGAYSHVDEGGEILAEALIEEGNPRGW